MNTQQLRNILRNHFKLDAYGQVYLDELEASFDNYGTKGLKTQLLYIISNAKAQGKEGQKARKSLIKWAQS